MAKSVHPPICYDVNTRRRSASYVFCVGNDIGSWVMIDALELLVHILTKSPSHGYIDVMVA